MAKGLSVIKLTAENIKRIVAVEITPEGNVITITGRNGQGKSSVLDSIMMALAGEKSIPKMPIRKGADKGKIVLDLGEFIIKRTFTAKNSYLEVTSKDKEKFNSPQQMLDKLIGALSFDPLDFIKMEKTQVSILKDLTGLNFTKLEEKRAEFYMERTNLGRQLKTQEAQLAGIPIIDDAPDKEGSIAELTQELERRNKADQAFKELKNQLRDMVITKDAITEEINSIDDEIAALQGRRDASANSLMKISPEIEKQKKIIVETKVEEPAEVITTINQLEEKNRKFRQAQERHKFELAIAALKDTTELITKQIGKIDSEKDQQLKNTKMPIRGLSFDDSGVLYNEIPFGQVSSAEQLKISLAIGMALNPRIRIILIRDGSLLDEDNMRLIAEMAKKNDYQVWLERVGTDGEVGILIEDGILKGDNK